MAVQLINIFIRFSSDGCYTEEKSFVFVSLFGGSLKGLLEDD
jgi:hypothetical protein